jgi:hypothetical protein
MCWVWGSAAPNEGAPVTGTGPMSPSLRPLGCGLQDTTVTSARLAAAGRVEARLGPHFPGEIAAPQLGNKVPLVVDLRPYPSNTLILTVGGDNERTYAVLVTRRNGR